MDGYNFSHSHLPVGLDGDVSAGTDGSRTALAEIDCKDCESVTLIIKTGTVTSGGILTAWAKGTDTSAAYGSGTVGDLGSATMADKSTNYLILEIRRPLNRYIKFYYQRTVANVVIESIVAIKKLNRDVRDTEIGVRSIFNQPVKSAS